MCKGIHMDMQIHKYMYVFLYLYSVDRTSSSMTIPRELPQDTSVLSLASSHCCRSVMSMWSFNVQREDQAVTPHQQRDWSRLWQSMSRVWAKEGAAHSRDVAYWSCDRALPAWLWRWLTQPPGLRSDHRNAERILVLPCKTCWRYRISGWQLQLCLHTMIKLSRARARFAPTAFFDARCGARAELNCACRRAQRRLSKSLVEPTLSVRIKAKFHREAEIQTMSSTNLLVRDWMHKHSSGQEKWLQRASYLLSFCLRLFFSVLFECLSSVASFSM